ncbi:MAG: hypothetical protein ACC651_05525, partial [Candidatus Scalindua sp.]
MMEYGETRRGFLRKIIMIGGMVALGSRALADMPVHRNTGKPLCILYRAVNGTPDRNLVKVMEMMGGIEKLIGSDDVVVIKPNAQWWNQGAPNLS